MELEARAKRRYEKKRAKLSKQEQGEYLEGKNKAVQEVKNALETILEGIKVGRREKRALVMKIRDKKDYRIYCKADQKPFTISANEVLEHFESKRHKGAISQKKWYKNLKNPIKDSVWYSIFTRR